MTTVEPDWFRYWVAGVRYGRPFAYDTGSNDSAWAEAVLGDVWRWPGTADARLEKREVKR